MRRRMLLLVLAGIVVLGLGWVWFVGGADLFPPSGRPAFAGESKDLKHTQIVATLDAPMEKGKNVIWCASFQAAWKELQTKLAKGPVKLSGGPDLAEALNRSYAPGPELPAGAMYATAGWGDQGILQQIDKEVARQFPGSKAPTFPGIVPGSFVAYSRLEAQVQFPLPYFQGRKPLEFTASDGTKTPVSCFGLPKEKANAYEDVHAQARLLYSNREDVQRAEVTGQAEPPREYVIDLDGESEPSQVIVAMIPAKATLAETLASLEKKISATKGDPYCHSLESSDVMLVPDVIWKLTHHFKELERRTLLNPGLKSQPMDVAQEDISFRLDRYGATVRAESKMYARGGSTPYLFDHPFLIVMRKRGETKPYFVMWVENAELLRR